MDKNPDPGEKSHFRELCKVFGIENSQILCQFSAADPEPRSDAFLTLDLRYGMENPDPG
jgi:hypothetical protein